MELATQVQILDKAVTISLSANALGKGMNPSMKWNADSLRLELWLLSPFPKIWLPSQLRL